MIPVSSHEAPFRVATTLPAFAAKIGQRNVYTLERSLKEHYISPVKLNELGVPVEHKVRPFGRLPKTVYKASVPGSHQKRLVMTDDQGALLAFAGKSIKDMDQLYWLDQLEASEGTS